MRGFVETPSLLVDQMVDLLFRGRHPTVSARLLDPGCGAGAFILGVLRWCDREGVTPPRIDGVELDPSKLSAANAQLDGQNSVHLIEQDFLEGLDEEYDFVIGNPPYVPITQLSETEKRRYRGTFQTAKGRFDLYFLFFEQAIRQLKPGGRMVYVTPEKFLYVESARELRKLLSSLDVKEIELVPEDAFPGLVTYPAVTSIEKRESSTPTRFLSRAGASREIRFSIGGDPLLSQMNGGISNKPDSPTLREVCTRISAGVATGADAVFVQRAASLDEELRLFAFPTISGRQLSNAGTELRTTDTMLVPYDRHGHLYAFGELNAFGEYLSQESVKARLLTRTCVERKPWYAYHETPPMSEILQPKILCKDITPSPRFWLDEEGAVVPRHTVYYMVPKPGVDMHQLAEYLSSDEACAWLELNCQRAANGFIRLQSSVLKELPIPSKLALQPDKMDLRLIRDSAPRPYSRSDAAVLIGAK